MSAKNLDQKGRFRSKIVAFRVSPEEDALIESAVKISGLTKQDFIIKRLQQKDVIVQGNPKVYKALKDELRSVLEQAITYMEEHLMEEIILDIKKILG